MTPTAGALVVVAIGTDVYGATDREAISALYAAAAKAAGDLALRGRHIDPSVIVERGQEKLRAAGTYPRDGGSDTALR